MILTTFCFRAFLGDSGRYSASSSMIWPRLPGVRLRFAKPKEAPTPPEAQPSGGARCGGLKISSAPPVPLQPHKILHSSHAQRGFHLPRLTLYSCSPISVFSGAFPDLPKSYSVHLCNNGLQICLLLFFPTVTAPIQTFILLFWIE